MSNLATIFGAEPEGISARTIEIEIDLNVGLHSFTIVGLADRALNEAKERVNSALKNIGAKPPNRENRKITINLAPADIRKTGSQYDLAIALGYLMATKQISKFETNDKIFLGELALNGKLRPINGALSIAEMAARRGFKNIFLPKENANEASAISKINIIPIENLEQAINIVTNKSRPTFHVFQKTPRTTNTEDDFSDIKGQHNAKRALIIAAAGQHNLLMIGPPGVGKSMMAKSLRSILPELTLAESIEITKIFGAAQTKLSGLITERPFRSPHQTASLAAIIGGGQGPKPGEISLAHRGILFLDELPEFPRNIIEALRGPMESGVATISRAKDNLKFPSKFSLIAAMNPCPCGFHGDTEKECRCGANEIIKYKKKISGPLLDRIDLQIRVPRISLDDIRIQSHNGKEENENSSLIKNSIEKAREIQSRRLKKIGSLSFVNADMNSRETEITCSLAKGGYEFLNTIKKTSISPRGYYRLLKTARTIADLESREEISKEDISEAWSYRIQDL